MMNLILDSKELQVFSNFLSKAMKKGDYLYIAMYDDVGALFSEYEGKVFYLEFESPGGEYYAGIDLQRFIGVTKKLPLDKSLLKLLDNKVEFVCGNSSASFPITKGFRVLEDHQPIEYSTDKEILKGFKNIVNAMSKNSRFDGVLVDEGRLCNFDNYQLVMSDHKFPVTEPFVVDIGDAGIIKAVIEKTFTNSFYTEHKFGIRLLDSVVLLFPKLVGEDNKYPKDYLSILGFDKGLVGLDHFVFTKKEFLDSVQMMFSTIGGSELNLGFEMVEDGCWRVFNKSNNGLSAEGFLNSETGIYKECQFGLNIKNLISSIKSFKTEDILFYDFSDKFVILSDSINSQLVFLLKNN